MKSGIFNPFFSINGNSGGTPFVIGVIGDSNADGATSSIPTVAPATLYNYVSGSYTEITTQSVANNSPDKGSIWQPFATAYKAQFNNPVYLINCAQGGSTFYTSPLYYWMTGAISLYPAAKTKILAGAAAAGKSMPDAIVLNLGINDVRSGYSLTNVTNAVNDVILKLTTDFPNVPILVIQVGREETNINSVDLFNIRELLVDKAQATTNMHIIGSAPAYSFLSGYESDGVHYNNTGASFLGTCLVNWHINSGYSKWGRAVISTLFDGATLSSARKELIDTFISGQVSNGNYFKLDELNVFKTTTANNLYIDWTMIGYGVQRTSTFVANSHIAFDGVSGRYDMAYVGSVHARRSTQTDILCGLKLRTNASTGTSYLFGTFDGTDIFGANQLASPAAIRYIVYDTTFSNGTDVLFQANNLYTIGRNGTTKQLYKNTTLQASATQATTGLTANLPLYMGCVNASGTPATFINGTAEYAFVSLNSSFDLSSFYNAIETLIAAW